MNPNIAIAILLTTFVPLIMVKYPTTFSMIISTTFTMLYIQVPVMTLVQQMPKQLNPFPLLATPFFIFMGEIMATDGISSRLLTFANVCVGQITGGLVHISVLASMLFDGVSDSVVADMSSPGALEISMMEEAGYEKNFPITVTVVSSHQGLIISPSHNTVLYSMVAEGVSVGSLFCAGCIPGIMLGVFIMVMCYVISKKERYPKGEKPPSEEALRVTKDTFFAMLTMVIAIGDVSTGSFAATEPAAISCVCCLLVRFSIYRELHLKDIPIVLGNTIRTLSMVYAFITAAGTFGWVMAYLNAPTLAANLLPGINDNKIVVLLLINLILLLLGCVMDLAPLILIMAPILLPVVTKFGTSSIQFGVMMILNLGIGLCMPLVGTALFTGYAIGNMKIERVSKAILPLYIPMPTTLLLVTFIPTLTMTLSELIME